MIVDLPYIKDCEEQRKGEYARDVFEQTLPPYFCLKVMCKKVGHICRNLWYVISHYSLHHNNLTDSGAIALANALQPELHDATL